MALRTSYSDANLVVDEPLDVTYTKREISGSWGYTSLNVSGTYNRMTEIHRYAKKRFRYVGMTFAAATACRDELKDKFTRTFRACLWNGDAMGGAWYMIDVAGTMPFAEVGLTENDDGSYDVSVSVSEDDVQYSKVGEAFSTRSKFAWERTRRTYGSDGHGNEDETEP